MRGKQTAGCFIVSEKGVILVHHTNSSWTKNYSIPKGHREKGESLRQTAIRETKEEIGADVDIWGKLGTVTYTNGKTVTAFIGTLKNTEILNDKGRVKKKYLQLEEVDWAGYMDVTDSVTKKKMTKTQFEFVERYKTFNRILLKFKDEYEHVWGKKLRQKFLRRNRNYICAVLLGLLNIIAVDEKDIITIEKFGKSNRKSATVVKRIKKEKSSMLYNKKNKGWMDDNHVMMVYSEKDDEPLLMGILGGDLGWKEWKNPRLTDNGRGMKIENTEYDDISTTIDMDYMNKIVYLLGKNFIIVGTFKSDNPLIFKSTNTEYSVMIAPLMDI